LKCPGLSATVYNCMFCLYPPPLAALMSGKLDETRPSNSDIDTHTTFSPGELSGVRPYSKKYIAMTWDHFEPQRSKRQHL